MMSPSEILDRVFFEPTYLGPMPCQWCNAPGEGCLVCSGHQGTHGQ
jgi:hypothetical protein